MTEVRVPTLGESVTEATVATWFKKPGDAVAQDEMLCELETDKVTVEVAAPVAGTLAEIVAPDGTTVGVDALLAQITEGAAATPAAPAPAAEAAPAPAAAPAAHGVKLGFMSFFTKACCHALKEIPEVNSEIDGKDVVYKNYVNMGIAAGTPTGLVVPVINDADQMSFADIEKAIAEKGARARDGKLSMAEMQGGTFTISNGGVYGSLMSSPILNPPQSGILGMHSIQKRAMVINDEIVIRPMMYLALSYDHRVVDGKGAVTFLVRVKEALEDPRRLLMDL